MIHVPCEPGSPEWFAARRGIPTSSNFDRIVTKTGKPSSQRTGYACKLIAEQLLGVNLDDFASEWMERGKELEEEAVNYYELQYGVETSQGGFCLTDDRGFGCSPDRLIGDDGGLEIKCPSPATHVAYMLGVDDADWKYRLQVQGSLWVTGRSWWHLMSYCPQMPQVLLRIERDEEFISNLETHLRAFRTTLDEFLGRVKGGSSDD